MPICSESSFIIRSMYENLEISADTYVGVFLAPLDVDGLLDKANENSYSNKLDWEKRLYCNFINWYNDKATFWEKVHLTVRSFFDTVEQFSNLCYETSSHFISEESFEYLLDPPKIRKMLAEIEQAEIDETKILEYINRRPLKRWTELLVEQLDRGHVITKHPDFDLDKYNTWVTEQQVQEIRRQRILQLKLQGKDAKSIPKLIRRQATKSIKMLEICIGKPNVSAFLSNEKVIISGHRYDYRISKVGYDIYSTHVPNLEILRKDGSFLAKGCLYFNDTPFFEQIVALCLHVRDYEGELEILTTANWSDSTDTTGELASLTEQRIKFSPRRMELQIEQDSLNLIEITRGRLHNLVKPIIFKQIQEIMPVDHYTLDLLLLGKNLEQLGG
jgi:hypothetical protein